MKKTLFSVVVLLVMASTGISQTKIDKRFDVSSFDRLDLQFEYPELVQIKVWKGKEVKVEGTVDIEEGKFDQNFEISSQSASDIFTIKTRIKDLKKISSEYSPNRDKGDTEKTRQVMSDKNNTIQVNRRSDERYVNGVKVSIVLVVTIPENMIVMLDARFGLVEVFEAPQSLEVEAPYGGVDVTVSETKSIQLAAKTQWGQIYTDLDIPFKMGGEDRLGEWLKAEASLKSGNHKLNVVSQYGNVYLRKN